MFRESSGNVCGIELVSSGEQVTSFGDQQNISNMLILQWYGLQNDKKEILLIHKLHY